MKLGKGVNDNVSQHVYHIWCGKSWLLCLMQVQVLPGFGSEMASYHEPYRFHFLLVSYVGERPWWPM